MSLEDDVIQLAARLTRVTGVDERTGLANLRLLVRDLVRELARGRRALPGIHLFVVQPDSEIDVVRFGDELGAVAREEDVVARLGDRQFAVLLVDASHEVGGRLSQKICNELKSLTPVSVGWRPVIGDELARVDAADIVRQAVSAAEEAHSNGGNQVVKWRLANPEVN